METIVYRNYCQNCGRPNHCGAAYYDELQNYDEPPSTLKVCDSCRCSNCENLEEDRK
jgi:hypothetical protein